MLLNTGAIFIDLSLIESFSIMPGADDDTIHARTLSGNEVVLLEVPKDLTIRTITLLNNIKQDDGLLTQQQIIDALSAPQEEETPELGIMEKYTRFNLYQDPEGSVFLVSGCCDKEGITFVGTADANTFEDATASLSFFQDYVKNQGETIRMNDAVRLAAHHELCYWISQGTKNKEIKLPSGDTVKFRYYQVKLTEDKK